MSKNEKDYEVVGNIRIKQPKAKKKKAKNNSSNTPFGIKILVWFMFIAMLASFMAPLVYYLITVISSN